MVKNSKSSSATNHINSSDIAKIKTSVCSSPLCQYLFINEIFKCHVKQLKVSKRENQKGTKPQFAIDLCNIH